MFLSGPSTLAKTALHSDLWVVLTCQHWPLEEVSSRFPSPQEWKVLLLSLASGGNNSKGSKGFRDPTQAQVGLPWALMLHTKAGNPTAPLHPEEEKGLLLIASLAITNILFPSSPSFNPNHLPDFPSSPLFGVKGVGIHIL